MHPSMHVFLTLYYVALCCDKNFSTFDCICINSYYIHLHTFDALYMNILQIYPTSDQAKIFGCNCPEWFCFRLMWPPCIFLCHAWVDMTFFPLMWPFPSSYMSYLLPIAHCCLCLKKPPIVPDICWYFWWRLVAGRRSRCLFDTSEFQLVVSNPRMIALTTPKVGQLRDKLWL